MGLIFCPDCGKEVSDRAPQCIHCGRPFDDLPKKVIRVCCTGEVILELAHTTQQAAERFINSITEEYTYPYGFKYTSGSTYRIIPDHEVIHDVKDLKCVVRQHDDRFVREADRLTYQEALIFKKELEEKQKRLNASLAAGGRYELIHTFPYWIVDNDAPLNYVQQPGSSRSSNIQQSQPHCPTCGSPHIERISATSKAAGAFAFGLFSKTARSQFRCKNCGYKW